MEESSWSAIHITYYDDRKDDLILDAVQPLLARIAGAVRCAYFTRHWRRGPQVLVPVLASPSAFRDVVEPAAREIVGGYLVRHPSTASLPPEAALLEVHRRLAEMEQDEGPLRPLRPDNSISFEAHDRRLRTLGGEAASDLLADFYAAGNDLTFRMLEHVRAGRSRETLGLSLMLAVAHSFWGDPPDIRSGFVSFRSHAEAFLHHSSDPAWARAQFDHRYERNRQALGRLVRGVLETLDRGGSGRVLFVSEWVELLRPFWVRAATLAESGQLGPALGQPPENPPAHGRGQSPLHQTMRDSDVFRRRFFDDPQFQRYRLTLNYTYLEMARLGVMGYARYLLCHLAANAVEETLGVDALQMIEGVVAGATAGAS